MTVESTGLVESGNVKKTICTTRSFEVHRLDEHGNVLAGRAVWHGAEPRPEPRVAQAQTTVIPAFIADQVTSAIRQGPSMGRVMDMRPGVVHQWHPADSLDVPHADDFPDDCESHS